MNKKHYEQSQDIPVDSAPSTVVSLVPSVTESLFDLNLGKCLIARTDYCIYPVGQVEHIPSIGGTKNPDLERIIALQPGLVIANQEENRREDVEALREVGIPVWVTFPQTVSDAFNLLWNLMYLFDETSMVERVRLIEYTYDWLSAISAAQEENLPRVFVPIWYEPLMTFNQQTYIHDLLRICGAHNVFASRERRFPLQADLGEDQPLAEDDARLVGRDLRYPRITREEVVSMQPDVVLLPSEPFAFDESHVAEFAALDIPAAKHGRIHLVDGSLLTWHGTRLAYALDQLPALFRIRDETG